MVHQFTRSITNKHSHPGALPLGGVGDTGLARTVHSNISQCLANVDWNFDKREPAHEIEAIHPYPAKFIGDLPRTLMHILPCQAGTCVLDPFSGSGTTMMEAQRLGLPSVGIDVNPIACLIAQVKTAAAPEYLTKVAQGIVQRAMQRNESNIEEIPNLNHWFKEEVQDAIAGLLEEVSKVNDATSQNALRLALSSILVRVSNQESDTRYAAIEKDVNRKAVFSHFLTAAKKLDSALSARNWSLTPVEVINANTLSTKPEKIKQPVGLVITSPPYPNAYEYWLYHKYRMWWLGFDPLAVKEQEIGARAHFFKRNGHSEDTFQSQMRKTFSLISKVLIPGGYACLVIGRSKIHGKIIDNAKIIQDVSSEYNFDMEARFDRVIQSSRKSFNLSHANIKKETVIVLRKG